ncbi:polysaccharide biosynthesis protein [Kosmotoga sp. DU53]|nr:nucleoside-diphosphate sugar epimerase/dehydratase [Kosmotoga sp. DU53]MDI3523416.1 hypothetical protein [Kosmotoga sp.]MDK2952914.1 hypothetical protein [Kosmotoga sp.]OAA19384.1 polysaccharide biosynthesis protein [Kosmotoga sp. DU53]
MEREKIRNFTRFIILTSVDFLLIYASYALGMYFRYGLFSLNEPHFFQNGLFFSFFILLSMIFNGVYSIAWSYSSFRDYWVILRGAFIGYAAGFAFGRLMLLAGVNVFTVPFTVATMTFIGATFLIIWSRIFWLTYLFLKIERSGKSLDRILIVGAGDAGTTLVDEITRHPEYGRVVGFVDDSPRKQKKRIRGIPVLGTTEEIMQIVDKYQINRVIIAIPSATSDQMRRIMYRIDRNKVRVQTLPGLTEIIDRKARLGYLRDINIEDLLGREPVEIDKESLRGYITGKRVLVTGAGGSIGSELCRQIAYLEPKALIILGKGENSIHNIEEELKEKYPDLKVHRVIGDVQDKDRTEFIIATFKPEIIFHAAAHKHVPIMEENPTEAFRVNTLGTYILASIAEKYGCERFVMISTDKAVRPSSIMGVSKRLAEQILKSIARYSKMRIGIVRFGNVLGSRGSVVPKFKKQIENGGPVTVTDPRMTRYFMTIPEAVSLVMQAGAYAKNGDVFVLDMGKPVKISDLARDMITLAGYVPDQEIKIEYIGARPGEKLFEELSLDSEKFDKTPHPKIFRLKDDREFMEGEELKAFIDKMSITIKEHDISEINKIIQQYVPDAIARVKVEIPELGLRKEKK